MQTWLMNEAACPPAVRQEPDNTLNQLDIDFWLWYWKVTPKGMACAFKIKFWEMFSNPRFMTYWLTISIKCQTAMMAVCGWEPQPHVLNGMKGWMRIKPSSNGSAFMLALPLSVSQRLSNCLPNGEQKTLPLAQHAKTPKHANSFVAYCMSHDGPVLHRNSRSCGDHCSSVAYMGYALTHVMSVCDVAWSKRPLCFKIQDRTHANMEAMLSQWQHNPEGVHAAIQQEADSSLNTSNVNIWMWLRVITPTKGVMVRQLILQLFGETGQWAFLIDASELAATSGSEMHDLI